MIPIEIKSFTEMSPMALEMILKVHGSIFAEPYSREKILNESLGKSFMLIQFALIGGKIAGFKAGYSKDNIEFYSWMGGTHPDFRNQGVASRLMEEQHKVLKEKGFKFVTTKTRNEFRSMLLLNIRYGFDIIGTHNSTKDNAISIMLEKKL